MYNSHLYLGKGYHIFEKVSIFSDIFETGISDLLTLVSLYGKLVSSGNKLTTKEASMPRKKTAKSKQPYGVTKGGYHHTEFGNTARMLDLDKNIRWCAALGYLYYDGTRWVADAENLVRASALRSIIAMYKEASDLLQEALLLQVPVPHQPTTPMFREAPTQQVPSDVEVPDESTTNEDIEGKRAALTDRAEALIKWAHASEKSSMISSMVSLCRSFPGIEVDIAVFDKDPYLFNFSNGTFDIETGKFRKHDPMDYITCVVPFNYRKDATCPVFQAFIHDIMCGNIELVDFLQKALGMCLTGDVSEQAWFLLLGSGENGKTTLLEAIAYVLNTYAGSIDAKSISVSKRDGSAPSPDIAGLRGKRLVRVSETEEGTRLATELIKKMSGGDEQQARFLNKDPFTFKFTHKLFVYTNHEPVIRESTHGFWRRVRKVPFDYTVPAEKKDRDLPKKLELEAEGILAWMVEGALKWKSEGLGIPEIIQKATQIYKEEQDVLGTFINDFCVKGDGKQVQSSVIYKKFTEWLTGEMGMRAFSQPAFKREMTARKFEYTRQTSGKDKGVRIFKGLCMSSKGASEGPSSNGHVSSESVPVSPVSVPTSNGHTSNVSTPNTLKEYVVADTSDLTDGSF
jgi:phage/plasmid primase, P4 family, C-terminal domain